MARGLVRAMMKRRESANWQFGPVRIPRDIQAALTEPFRLWLPLGPELVPVTIRPGQSVIGRLSLGTTDDLEAARRNLECLAAVRGAWQMLREARPLSLTNEQAHALAGELYRPWARQPRPGTVMAVQHNPETNQWRRVTVPGGEFRAKEWKKIIKGWRQRGEEPEELEAAFGPIIDRLLQEKGIARIDPASRELVLKAFRRALVDAFKHRRRMAKGDFEPDPKAERFPAWQDHRGAGEEELMGEEGPSPPVTITGLFEDWARERDPSASTLGTYGSVMRRFVRFLKHDDARRVTRADVLRFKDQRLADGVSARTIKDGDLAALKAVFGWGLRNDRLEVNPAEGVTLARGKPMRLRPKGFTAEEAGAILAHARSYRRKHKSELEKTALAKRWVPWLCAYTGARVGEVCQLRKQDVREARLPGEEGRVWIITITPEAGPVKDRQAREVPLHEHLIAEGFPAVIEAASEGYLFREPPRAGTSRPGHGGVVNRVATFVREVVPDRRVSPNHGWRHTFKTIGREAEIEGLILDAICGHAPGSVGASYGDVSVKAMAKALKKFPRFEVPASPPPSPQPRSQKGV